MLQLLQSSVQTIALLAHNEGPLIDVVGDQIDGHPLVQPLHIPVHNQKVPDLVRIVADRDFLQLEAPICAFSFHALVLHQEQGAMGPCLVLFVDNAPL